MSEPVIQLSKVNVFQQQNLILHHVDLTINKGEFVYLIGRTGSGKSSLLKTLYGALPLTEGEGKIAGFDLRSLSRKQIPFLRRSLGIVFQDFQLLTDRSVINNLIFVLKATGWTDEDKIRERAESCLDKVGLLTKDYKMPHEISGGEQQRVVIARALLNNPQIILADEPTGNLDPEVTDEIMKLLKDICNEGTAILMATHDYRIINKFYGNNIYKCENSKIFTTNFLT